MHILEIWHFTTAIIIFYIDVIHVFCIIFCIPSEAILRKLLEVSGTSIAFIEFQPSRNCYFVAAYFIRDTLIFTHGKPLLRLSTVPDLSITWSSLIRLSVNDKIDASEVIDSLNDVIHFYAFALYVNSIGLIPKSDHSGLKYHLFSNL